jgi:hypothetical protein
VVLERRVDHGECFQLIYRLFFLRQFSDRISDLRGVGAGCSLLQFTFSSEVRPDPISPDSHMSDRCPGVGRPRVEGSPDCLHGRAIPDCFFLIRVIDRSPEVLPIYSSLIRSLQHQKSRWRDRFAHFTMQIVYPLARLVARALESRLPNVPCDPRLWASFDHWF